MPHLIFDRSHGRFLSGESLIPNAFMQLWLAQAHWHDGEDTP